MRQTVFGVLVLTALVTSITIGRAQGYRPPTALPLQDVSGTWIVDDQTSSKDILLPNQDLIRITQADNTVTIETRGAKFLTLPMDGTPTNVRIPQGPVVGTARWLGNVLMVTTKGEPTWPNNGESVAMYYLNVAGNLEVISQFNLTDGAAKGVSFITHQYKRE